MRVVALTLAMLTLTLPLGCRQSTTPLPTPLTSTIAIKVFVVRDIDDDSQAIQNKIGYIYSDNHIRSLVTDMIDRSDILAGVPVTFSWPGQVVNEIVVSFFDELQITSHAWLSYPGWVPFLSTRPGYQSSAVNIFFVPGIIDASNPSAFMDSVALDPAHNNDVFWDTHPWRPMILISDCWVHSGVTEQVFHMPQGIPSNRRVPTANHFDHLLMHHALGRYLFRHESGLNWTLQESYSTAGGPPHYMRLWDRRASEPGHQTEGIFQGEIFERINSGNWNNP